MPFLHNHTLDDLNVPELAFRGLAQRIPADAYLEVPDEVAARFDGHPCFDVLAALPAATAVEDPTPDVSPEAVQDPPAAPESPPATPATPEPPVAAPAALPVDPAGDNIAIVPDANGETK